MSFAKALNSLVQETGCTSHELAEASGVSSSTISRYRSGKRQPKACSSQVRQIAQGLATLTDPSDSTLAERMERLLNEPLREAAVTLRTDNLNALIETLGISMSALAKFLNFDASYLSRVRSGKRNPADVMSLVEGVCRYVVSYYRRAADWRNIGDLVGAEWGEAPSEQDKLSALRTWLTSSGAVDSDQMDESPSRVKELLRSTDELEGPLFSNRLSDLPDDGKGSAPSMELAEWIHLGPKKLTENASPQVLEAIESMKDPVSHVFTGERGAEDAVLVFRTLLEMRRLEGAHLEVKAIHAMNGTAEKIIHDLIEWMPLCLAGRMKTYCLEGYCYPVRRLLLVTEGIALEGSFSLADARDALFVVTTEPQQVEALRFRFECLMPQAVPVMDVYDSESNNERLRAMRLQSSECPSRRRGILSTPPIHTLPQSVLRSAMMRSGATVEEFMIIWRGVSRLEALVVRSCRARSWIDDVSLLTKEEFDWNPPNLPLAGLLANLCIPYTYEEYCEHARATSRWADANPGFSVRFHKGRVFRNLHMFVAEGDRAVVLKDSLPNVEFVFSHPQIVRSMERMVVAMGEQPVWGE